MKFIKNTLNLLLLHSQELKFLLDHNKFKHQLKGKGVITTSQILANVIKAQATQISGQIKIQ